MSQVTYTRYFLGSLLAATGVVYHAFATRQHFYPATLYMSTSKVAVAVMGNLAFACALMIQKLVIKVFLGSLRDIEREMVRERLSSTIMESLLALTIFREEFSSFFVAMFITLVFVKVLHWLVQDRVDYIEVTPSVSRLQHARIVVFMSALLVVDALFLQYTLQSTIASNGQSVMLLFAFEYLIQASDVVRYFLKYSLSMIDLALEGRWESKGTYVNYLELTTDLLQLTVYSVFFVLVFINYGLPLHLVRDLYSTFRNFRNRMIDFLRFRQVSARLDRLPDATAEDLERSDGVCIICREEMTGSGANKKLHCGHVFHMHCLRSWLERQQNCPTCRASVFQPQRPAAPAAAAPQPPQAEGAAEPVAAAAAVGAAAEARPAAVQAQQPAAAGQAALRAQQQAQQHVHHPHVHVHLPHQVRFVPFQHHPPHAAHAAAPAAAAATAAPAGPAAQPASGSAPAAAAASGVLPPEHVAPAAAGLAQAPLMWQVPAPWYPPISMAAFPPPSPIQYAGQQQPQLLFSDALHLHPMSAAMMPGMLPLLPLLPPPIPPMPLPVGANSIEQQAAAAAAAAAVAAAAAMYNPMVPLMMPLMPPTPVVMPPAAPAAGSAAAAPEQAAAAGSQTAVATAEVAGDPPEVAHMRCMLQRHVEVIQAQIERMRQAQQQAAVAAPAPAAPAASAPQQQTAAAGADVAQAAGPSSAAAEPATTTAAAGGSADAASVASTSSTVAAQGVTPTTPTIPAAPAAQVSSADCSSSTATAPASTPSGSGAGASSQESTQATAAATEAPVAAAAPASSPAPAPSVVDASVASPAADEQSELRRRRLQHFAQQQQQH